MMYGNDKRSEGLEAKRCCGIGWVGGLGWIGALVLSCGLSWSLSAAAEETSAKPGAAQEGASQQEAASQQDASAKRTVIRTTADGKIEVVGADPSADEEEKDRQALEAMAQRLWLANNAEQTLEQRTAPGRQGAPTAPAAGGKGSLGPASGLQAAQQPQNGAAPKTAAGAAPCLATAKEDAETDPCEIARRIGRLQPCRTPQECEAYDVWRQQYGVPGLRAAKPAGSAEPAEDPDKKP